MKKAKYFLCFMLILCSFVLSGELYQHYLDSNFVYGIYSFQINGAKDKNDISYKERHETIKELSAKNECNVFYYEISLLEGKLTRTITIYANEETANMVMRKCHIEPGRADSLFLGSTNFVFKNYDEVSCKENMKYYFLGDTENINNIRKSLTDNDYNCINFDANTYKESFDWLLILMWVAFAVILTVLTWIDIQFKKKERLVLVSLGKPIYKIILESVISDTAIILAVYIGLYIILSRVTYMHYLSNITSLIFIGALLLNIIITVLIMCRLDIRKAFSSAKISGMALANCYVIKTVSIIATIIILTLNIIQLQENIDILKQTDNFESFDGYSYISIAKDKENEFNNSEINFNRKINATIFFDKYTKGEVTFSYQVIEPSDNIPATMIIDKSAVHLLDTIDEIHDLEYTKDLYILLPDSLNNKEQNKAIENAVDASKLSLGIYSEKAEYEVINYNGKHEILVFDNNNSKDAVVNFDTLINPIIVLCNLSDEVMPKDVLYESGDNLFASNPGGTFYKITEEDAAYYSKLLGLERKGYHLVLTDAYERNDYSRSNITRLLSVNIVMSVFMLLFELMMIATIVRLEYMSNSIEMSLKKVFGYSLFKRNRSVFSLYTFGVFIGVFTTTVAAWILQLHILDIILCISIAILLTEYATITFYILKLEKIGVTKILKGGCL